MKNLLKKLKKVRNKFLLNKVKKLYNECKYIECEMYINKISFNIFMDYIWYCPRKSCNAIILKTNKPFLEQDEQYKCKRCNTFYQSEALIISNKRNLKKYIDKIEENIK